MQAPTKEEMLKRVTDPQMVPNAVNKFFTELDPENTGFIAVDAFLERAHELGKQAGSPGGSDEEKRKQFAGFVAQHATDGKLNRENLTTVMTAFFKQVATHLQSLP